MTEPAEQYDGRQEELLSLAAAVSSRKVTELLWTRAQLERVMPLEPLPSTDIVQSVQTGFTVALLRHIDDPESGSPSDYRQSAYDMLDDSMLEQYLISVNHEPNELMMALMRSQVTTQVDAMFDTVGEEMDLGELLQREVAAAREVAAERGVAAEQVFATDELFEEMTRHMYSPQSYVEEQWNFFEQSTQALKTQLMQESDDAAYTSELETRVALAQKATRVFIREGIRRFWGEETLREMDAQHIGELVVVEDAKVSDSPHLTKMQSHADRFAVACMERGWDPNQLSTAQYQQVVAAVDEMN